MLDNLRKHKRPDGDGKGGIYFGATGCGKTYAMLFLARQLMLRDKESFNNPTIVLITDREDLDDQVSKKFVIQQYRCPQLKYTRPKIFRNQKLNLKNMQILGKSPMRTPVSCGNN